MCPRGGGFMSHTTGVPVTRRGRQRAWCWTPKKKTAFQLALAGFSGYEMALRVGVSRRTITRWSHAPEWLARFRERIGERRFGGGLRHAHIADTMAEKLW